MKIKTVSPEELKNAYEKLFPDEKCNENLQILGNWLKRYEEKPEACISVSNWYGKVTKALFVALRTTMPNNKKDMLLVLRGEI